VEQDGHLAGGGNGKDIRARGEVQGPGTDGVRPPRPQLRGGTVAGEGEHEGLPVRAEAGTGNLAGLVGQPLQGQGTTLPLCQPQPEAPQTQQQAEPRGSQTQFPEGPDGHRRQGCLLGQGEVVEGQGLQVEGQVLGALEAGAGILLQAPAKDPFQPRGQGYLARPGRKLLLEDGVHGFDRRITVEGLGAAKHFPEDRP